MKLASFVVVLAALAGCGRPVGSILGTNDPPRVTVQARCTGAERLVHWSGTDPDGRVDHYRVVVNPLSVDRVDDSWERTKTTDHREASPPDVNDGGPLIVAVRAVDDLGAISDPGCVAFFGSNVAPSVRLTYPSPSYSLPTLDVRILGPTVTFRWEGTDSDGSAGRPVAYKCILLGPDSELPPAAISPGADTIGAHYAPAFAGWDSVGGDSTSVTYRNLAIGKIYVFAVTAIDEVGDYDPVFSFSKNLLRFRVASPKAMGPALTVRWGTTEGYEFITQSEWNPASILIPRVEVRPHRTIALEWSAQPIGADGLAGFRWVLDPMDLHDESTRATPDDLHHWSPRDSTKRVTLGPFDPGVKGTTHVLYVEAMDTNGNRTLGGVRLFVFRELAEPKDLLIVDDTRLMPDRLAANGCVAPPSGPWPTAAELDTFLYARGGMPWQCYPEGTISAPGLFNGYRFDTLGTRGLSGGVVSLSTLMRYRHVIWLTDQDGALFVASPSSLGEPVTALRYMSGAGRQSTLAAYVAAGGNVWLAGGGAALASQDPWDDRNNDPPDAILFSRSGARNELGPGRFMYDLPIWRSEIRVHRAVATLVRFTGRFDGTGAYGELPAFLRERSPSEGPLPPLRLPYQYWVTSLPLEYLSLPNDSVPGGGAWLDTLYEAIGTALPPTTVNPHHLVMTYAHEPGRGTVLFSGFAPWHYETSQIVRLADFVLQKMWGLSRSGTAAPASAARTRRVARADRPAAR